MPGNPGVELVFYEALTSLAVPAFCEAVRESLLTSPAHLWINLEDVKVADVAGPAALLQAVRLCEARGTPVSILASPAIYRAAPAVPRVHRPARAAAAYVGRAGTLRGLGQRPAARPDGGQPAPLPLPSPRALSSGLRRPHPVRPIRADARRPAAGPGRQARRLCPPLQREPGRTLRVPRDRDRQRAVVARGLGYRGLAPRAGVGDGRPRDPARGGQGLRLQRAQHQRAPAQRVAARGRPARREDVG